MRARHTAVADRHRARARRRRFGPARGWWPAGRRPVFLAWRRGPGAANQGPPAVPPAGAVHPPRAAVPAVRTVILPTRVVHRRAPGARPVAALPASPLQVTLARLPAPIPVAAPVTATPALADAGRQIQPAGPRRFGPVPASGAPAAPQPTTLVVPRPGAAPAPAAPAARRPVRVPVAVEQVVRRSVDTVRITERVAAALERRAPGDHQPARPGRERLPPRPAALAAIDVERLADQVIAAIDRRTIAYRERMGRL